MGFLPGARPVTASYGEDVQDEFPIEAPNLETSANDFNALRADVIFMGQVTPLAIVSVSNNGTVVAVLTASGVLASNVTVARTGAGVVTLDFTTAHITLNYGMANPNNGSLRSATFQVTGAQTATVRTYDGAGPADGPFFAIVY